MPILIIEDEFLVAAEIRFHLERAGYGDVKHCATERDALTAIADQHWDAAVVDANLNGRTIDRIAEALENKAIAFLVVTGYGRAGLPRAVGPVPVIEKPFQPKLLLETFSRLTGSR
jgi:CheY-like chemotaxis protein